MTLVFNNFGVTFNVCSGTSKDISRCGVSCVVWMSGGQTRHTGNPCTLISTNLWHSVAGHWSSADHSFTHIDIPQCRKVVSEKTAIWEKRFLLFNEIKEIPIICCYKQLQPLSRPMSYLCPVTTFEQWTIFTYNLSQLSLSKHSHLQHFSLMQ